MKRILLLGLAAAVVAAAAERGALRVGAARVEVTPAPHPDYPPSGKYDHERLYIRAIVLDNGVTRGALIGAVLAHGAGRLAPSIADQAEVLAVLGMAAMFVGSVRAPLTGIVLISEMTNGYELLFPICIAGLAAYLTGEALREPPVYDALLEADLHRSGQALNKPEPRSMYIGVQTGSPLAGRKLKDAGLPRGCLVTAVERAGVIILPAADTLLLPGDHVSILAPGDQPDAPLEIVRLCTGL